MSETKTPKKDTAKKDTAKKDSGKAETADKSESKSAETSTPSKPSNKSASQSSISHFSSVATDEYRSGWANIFANGKTAKKSKAKKTGSVDLPVSFEIQDEDIKADLRALLYKAFQRQARKDGISLAQLKKSSVIEYRLDCDVSEK